MKKLLLLLIFNQLCWTQETSSLESDIYKTVDQFINNPSIEAISFLSKTEKQFYTARRPKNKNEYLALVILKCNKAYYLQFYGKSYEAIKEYEATWEIFKQQKLSNYDIIEYCLKPLGNLYTIKGDFLSAENTIKEYYYLAIKTSTKNEYGSHKISALLNLSAVYQSSGKHNQAISLIENAISNENISSFQKARFYNNLGNNYLSINQLEKAEKSFKNSISLLRKENSESYNDISNAYKNLAQLYQQQNNFSSAEKALDQSTRNLHKVPNIPIRQLFKLEFAKALLYYQKGDFKNSHFFINNILKGLIPNYNENNLPLKNQLYQETILIDALDLKAKLYTSSNKPKKALEAYSLSFHVEDLLQNDVFHEESRIVFQIKNRNRVEKCLLLFYQLFKQEKNKKYIIKAFELKEKYNSGVLNFMISKISNSGTKEKKLIEKIQQLNSLIAKEQLKREHADISKINYAIQLQNESMLELKKISKNNTEQHIDINSLVESLKKDNTDLISYFYGTETAFMFHFKKNEIDFHLFKDYKHLNLAIKKLSTFFNSSEKINDNLDAFKKTSFDVYKKLCLKQIINTKNIIIIPDGALHYIPFESLITQQSSNRDFSKIPFLIYQTKIVYSNSVSSYLTASKKTSSGTKRILGFFPIFNSTSFSLPYSKKEYEFLSKNIDGKYFIEKEATFSNFVKNTTQFDIIHLSTHATSGDIYEPAQIKFIEQDITFNELYSVKTNADLVVLSACETGLGKLYQGEGFMSIARGFQMGGTQNLVFSLWKVNDFTTFKIITNFYSYIRKNHSYSNALHYAKLDFLKDKTIPNAKKSPYYWSSLVYYGVIEEEHDNYWIIASFIIAGLGLCIAIIGKKHLFYK